MTMQRLVARSRGVGYKLERTGRAGIPVLKQPHSLNTQLHSIRLVSSTSPNMSAQRAALLVEKGEPLEVRKRPIPVPSDDQVLVKLEAAASTLHLGFLLHFMTLTLLVKLTL